MSDIKCCLEFALGPSENQLRTYLWFLPRYLSVCLQSKAAFIDERWRAVKKEKSWSLERAITIFQFYEKSLSHLRQTQY